MARKKSDLVDIVVLKSGESFGGEVLVKEFTLKMKYGVLKIKKRDIRAVYYRNPPYIVKDEVQVSESTRLEGDLLPKMIDIRMEKTGALVSIPKEDVTGLVMFWGWSGKAVLAKTKRALAGG
jgi:hypothetical protein